MVAINDEHAILLEKVRRILPSEKYTNIQPFTKEEGAQRKGFTAVQGNGNGGRKVFISVDKTPSSPAAERLADKGYTTTREVDVLFEIPFDEALAHKLNPVLDSYFGEGIVAGITPFFEDSSSLRRTVTEKGPLSKIEFNTGFADFIEAERYLIEQKRTLNRDPNPGNILLRKRKGRPGLEARLVDHTTAILIDEAPEGIEVTGGQRSISDPALSCKFTGKKDTRYTAKSEVYSIAADALFALTGNTPVYYDPRNGTGIDNSTQESLIDENGRVIPEKHNASVEGAIRKLPKWASKHKEWIRRSLDINPNNRPDIGELSEQFQKASKPSYWDRFRSLKNKTQVLIAGGLAATMLAGGFGAYKLKKESDRQEEQHRQEIVEAKKYNIEADWNGHEPKINNNLFDLKLSGWVIHGDPIVESNLIKVKPGDKINLNINGKLKPLPNDVTRGNLGFNGQVFIEGYEINGKEFVNFSLDTLIPQNEAGAYDDGAMYGSSLDLEVPDNLQRGTYSLDVAVFSPGEKDFQKAMGLEFGKPKNIKFSYGKVLALTKLKLVVGDLERSEELYEVRVGPTEDQVTIGRNVRDGKGELVRRTMVEDINFAYYVHAGNSVSFESSQAKHTSISFPKGKSQVSTEVGVATYDENRNIILFEAFPVQRKALEYGFAKIDPDYFWKLDLPGTNFAQSTIKIRKELETRIKGYCATNSYSFPSEKTSR